MRFALNRVPKDMVGQSMLRGQIVGMAVVFLFLQSWLIASNRGPLCEAAREGDVETIEKLLADGYNIHSSNGSRLTPLHEAARAGHVEVAKLLIVRGARVNNRPRCYGRTPLHEAAGYGHTKVVQLLLDHGTEVNAQSEFFYGSMPLHEAAKGGHTKVVQLVIEHGAEVNAVARESTFQYRYHRDHTALYYAASRGHVAIVSMLFQAGATLYTTEDDREHLLFDAVCRDNRVVVQVLLDNGAKVNIAQRSNGYDQGRTPLHCVRSKEMAELLLRAGAVLSAKHRSAAVLHDVSWFGTSPDLIDFFVERGVDVHDKDKGGQTALHMAAKNSRGAMLQTLLIHGADVDVQDCRGDTPLHKAAETSWYPAEYEKKYLRNVQVLLCAGANPNARNSSGQTPLHKAWCAGNTVIFKELVARGAEFISKEAGEFVSAEGNRMGMAFYAECRALARERCRAIALFLESLIDTVGLDVVNWYILPRMLSDTQREQLKEIKCSNEIVFQLSSYLKFAKSLFS